MNRFSFLMTLCVLALVACGDDDEMSGGDVVGTWQLEATESRSETEAAGISTIGVLTYISGDVELEFKEDGTYTQVGSGLYESATILGGDTFSIQQVTLDLTQNGTYTTSNGQLTGFAVQSSSLPQASGDQSAISYTVTGNSLIFDLNNTPITTAGTGITVTASGSSTYRKL